MSIISLKSSLSPRRLSRVRYQKSMVGKTCEKDKFWAESEKEKELRRVEMMMYMNCHEWSAVNMKETGCRNETGSWFQRASGILRTCGPADLRTNQWVFCGPKNADLVCGLVGKMRTCGPLKLQLFCWTSLIQQFYESIKYCTFMKWMANTNEWLIQMDYRFLCMLPYMLNPGAVLLVKDIFNARCLLCKLDGWTHIKSML